MRYGQKRKKGKGRESGEKGEVKKGEADMDRREEKMEKTREGKKERSGCVAKVRKGRTRK